MSTLPPEVTRRPVPLPSSSEARRSTALSPLTSRPRLPPVSRRFEIVTSDTCPDAVFTVMTGFDPLPVSVVVPETLRLPQASTPPTRVSAPVVAGSQLVRVSWTLV